MARRKGSADPDVNIRAWLIEKLKYELDTYPQLDFPGGPWPGDLERLESGEPIETLYGWELARLVPAKPNAIYRLTGDSTLTLVRDMPGQRTAYIPQWDRPSTRTDKRGADR